VNGVEELLLAAAGLEAVLQRNGWGFCFIGGVAVQRWGNPRFTEDRHSRTPLAGQGPGFLLPPEMMPFSPLVAASQNREFKPVRNVRLCFRRLCVSAG
jgi:hypothetical protein